MCGSPSGIIGFRGKRRLVTSKRSNYGQCKKYIILNYMAPDIYAFYKLYFCLI